MEEPSKEEVETSLERLQEIVTKKQLLRSQCLLALVTILFAVKTRLQASSVFVHEVKLRSLGFPPSFLFRLRGFFPPTFFEMNHTVTGYEKNF